MTVRRGASVRARSGHALTTHILAVHRLSRESRRVLQTVTAQVGLWSVTSGDACGLDRRLRCIPRMSQTPRVGLSSGTLVGVVFVGEVPDADVTGLDPDDDIRTAERLHVCGAFFRAEIPGCDAQRGLGHALLDEAC